MSHKITALSIQKRNPKRLNVYLDGAYAFGIARILAAWLEVGQEISDEKIAELQAEDSRESAYLQALRLLGYRQRTEAEVRRNLHKHEIPAETVDYVIARLRQNRLVDDENFAQNFIESRSESRPRSRRALQFELRRHGVDPILIEHALEDIDDEELAYQAALKKARRLKGLEWQDFRQKMYSHLIQRGFNYSVASQAVGRVWKEINAAENSAEEEGLP
jgi:regulatory protein